MDQIETDVLVIGGGLAGLCAALEARRTGRETLLLCKGKAGRSGNTVLAACNISGVFSGEDAPEAFARDVMDGGEGISDPDLVRTLAEGSASLVPFLEGVGVRFLREEGRLIATFNPGHRTARTITTVRSGLPVQTAGLSLTLPLLQAVQEAGVRLVEGGMVLDLLLRDGAVRGAAVLNRDGRPMTVAAGAVVLACGGGGRLFAQSNNTAEMTGDGLALAYGAGAELRDLEFVQFHPTMGISPLRSILPTTLFADGAVLRNRAGERFLLRDHPEGEVSVTRDAMSRAIDREIREGRGVDGGVFLDLTGVSPAAAAGRYRDLWDLLRRRGCRPESDWPTIGLAVHFLMGGMTIDARGASTVPGLFGAGEVTGGVHGTNRLGGNALTEAVVFGRIAGRSAVQFVAGTRGAPAPFAWTLPGGGGTPEELARLRQEVKEILLEHAGVVRSGPLLERGLERLEALDERFGRLPAGPPSMAAAEARHMLTAARLILLAALRRTESRGAHFRSDFPDRDPRLGAGSFRLRRGEDGPEITFR